MWRQSYVGPGDPRWEQSCIAFEVEIICHGDEDVGPGHDSDLRIRTRFRPNAAAPLPSGAGMRINGGWPMA